MEVRLRDCRPDEAGRILEIVNAAAERYRGVIPADRWHDPYMTGEELAREIADGVAFTGVEAEGELVGVMGAQAVQDVRLVRHAYVLPAYQGVGVGGRLLRALIENADRPVLVGTWADAEWAIRFYERHGFRRVPRERIAELLRRYWRIPERQIETSVVLELRRLSGG